MQISDPEPGPGLWLTDIVTGVRRYAAIPPEQLPGISRWSVLLGALVSLDGIWRSTGAVVLLRPSEGDGAAEWVHDASAAIAQAVAGTRRRRPGRRREPHGVLVARSSPGDAISITSEKAAVVAKVLQKVFDQLHDRVAGLDVHKAQVTAAVRVPSPDGGRLLEVTEFRTTVQGLLALRDWLSAHGVTYVAMEATGVYWKPLGDPRGRL